MALHDLPLVGVERAFLEQDAVGRGDFADIEHRGRETEQSLISGVELVRTAEHFGVLAHAHDVQARLAIAKLGGACEPVDRFFFAVRNLFGRTRDVGG